MKPIIFTLIFILTSFVSFGIERDTVLVAKNKKNNKVFEFNSGKNVKVKLSDSRSIEGDLKFTSDTTFVLGINTYEIKLSDIEEIEKASSLKKIVEGIIILIIFSVMSISSALLLCASSLYILSSDFSKAKLSFLASFIIFGLEFFILRFFLKYKEKMFNVTKSKEKYDFSIEVK